MKHQWDYDRENGLEGCYDVKCLVCKDTHDFAIGALRWHIEEIASECPGPPKEKTALPNKFSDEEIQEWIRRDKNCPPEGPASARCMIHINQIIDYLKDVEGK